MADELVDAEPGTDLVPADDTANVDAVSALADDVDDAAAADVATDKEDDPDLDLEAEAARLAAEKVAQDAEAAAAKKPDADADAAKVDPDKVGTDAAVVAPPKTIAEAIERLEATEARTTQLTEMETKVLEIGGLPLIEMVQPLIDTISNPEAKFGDILMKIADATGRDPQDMAYELLESEENQAAALAHFCGEDITPDILTQLVDGYQSGAIKLGEAESEEEAADDVFLTDKERKDRERLKASDVREKASAAREKATLAAEKTATATRLEGERTTAQATLGAMLQTTVETAIADFKADPKDTPEVKDLKEVMSLAVNAITMLELSRDPTFQRVQGLIKTNGLKAADALAKGALAIKVSQRAAAIAKRFNPAFSGAVTKLQKAAAKVAAVRVEPAGARGAADLPGKLDTSVKNKNWRADLDKEFEGKIADLGKKQTREATGRFA